MSTTAPKYLIYFVTVDLLIMKTVNYLILSAISIYTTLIVDIVKFQKHVYCP